MSNYRAIVVHHPIERAGGLVVKAEVDKGLVRDLEILGHHLETRELKSSKDFPHPPNDAFAIKDIHPNGANTVHFFTKLKPYEATLLDTIETKKQLARMVTKFIEDGH